MSKDISRGRLKPNDVSNSINSSNSIKTLEPINPPLNSYKDFANVFNVKGMLHGSKGRKHSKFMSENN